MTIGKAKNIANAVVDGLDKKVTKPFIDLMLGKTMSRKLQVLILATWLVKIDKISGDAWMFIALLYVLGILWLNHVQAMGKLGKGFMGKAGSPEHRQHGRKYNDRPIDTKEIPEED